MVKSKRKSKGRTRPAAASRASVVASEQCISVGNLRNALGALSDQARVRVEGSRSLAVVDSAGAPVQVISLVETN